MVIMEEEDAALPLGCTEDFVRIVREEVQQIDRNKKRKHESNDDDGANKRGYTYYNRERALANMQEDYFSPTPIFNDRQFE